MSVSKLVSIEPFKGENFQNWKFRVESLLLEHDLIECIENTKFTKLIDKGDQNAKKKDNRAKNMIIQCIHDSQLSVVRNKSTAYAMWMALTEMFEKRGLCGKLMLKKKLMNMKMANNESIDEYVLRFEKVIEELQVIDSKDIIQDEDKICNFLLGLPNKYDLAVRIIESLPDMTFELVKKHLRNEDEKLMARNNGRSSDSILKPQSFEASNRKCYRCNRYGHISHECHLKSKPHNQYTGQSKMHYQYSGQSKPHYQYSNQPKPHYQYSGQSKPSYQYNNLSRLPNNQSGHYNEQSKHEKKNNKFNKGGVYHNSSGADYCDNNTNNDKSVTFNCEQNDDVFQDQCKDEELKFYIDSGCTDHIVTCKNYFSSYVDLKPPISISVAKDGETMSAIGMGTIEGFLICNGKQNKCILKNVLFVPSGRRNLLSVKRMENGGNSILFAQGEAKLFDSTDELIGIGKRTNLYELSIYVKMLDCNVVENNDQLWHKRYGHISYHGLNQLSRKNLVDGMNVTNIDVSRQCEGCIDGKLTRLPFDSRRRAKRVLEIVHTDVCGPVTETSFEGYRYFVTFLDDFTHFSAIYCIRTKDEVLEKFKHYFSMVRSKFNQSIHTLRCDNGGEYSSRAFQNFCQENGVIIDYTVPYTPEQNGKAERLNRSIVEKARSMLNDSGVEKKLWCEAVCTAVYIINRSPTSTLENKTPAELWYSEKPNVQHMRVFGCRVYFHIPKELRTKLDSKAKKGILLGYSPNGYRVFDTDKQKVRLCRDVKFNESCFPYKNQSVDVNVEDSDERQCKPQHEIQSEDSFQQHDVNDEYSEETQSTSNEENVTVDVDQFADETNNNQGSRRRRVPKRFDDFELYVAYEASKFVDDIPVSYPDIAQHPNAKEWYGAVSREIESIEENETWDVVDKPSNVRVLDSKWVFALKEHETQDNDKFKARLVVRGFNQDSNSFNYDEIYSPVARLSTIRTVLAIGNENKFRFDQLDVKTAFLNGELKDDVFMYPPEGVSVIQGKVLKLRKSLYGLKQAAKCWNDTFSNFLIELGFQRSLNDSCLYTLNKSGKFLYLCLYVDDILLASKDDCLINSTKEQLMKKFKIKDKGPVSHFLGLEIQYDRENGIMKIGQTKFAEKLLSKFNMSDCKSNSIPINPQLTLLQETSSCSNKPYRELIGSIMYLMLGTRPDLSFCIHYFSRYQNKYSDELWIYLKDVLKYIKGTVNLGLVYKCCNQEPILTCYCDSDWASDKTDRKSVTGYLFNLYGNLLVWSTKKQKCISLSTTESELVALCSALTEGLWLQKLLQDLGIDTSKMLVYEDNQGCINIVKNPGNNRRVKHIDIKYHFICEQIQLKNIEIKYIESKQQIADILTKALNKYQFDKLRQYLGLVNI